MEGHGIEGRYGGLPDAFCNREHSAIAIVPVAFDQTTTYQKGADKGPAALIEASRNMELYDIETDSEVYTKGIYTAETINEESSDKMREKLFKQSQLLLREGKFVVTIGGEHSISFASINAHAERYGKLTVLQFDAHADLVPAYEDDPWSHASVMARVKEIPEVTKIVSVGIRSMSIEELPFLDKERTIFAQDIDDEGEWIDRLINLLSDNIYLTFDLDVFDSGIMPSTGTPEPGGINWNQAIKALKRVVVEKGLVGCDIVELCPNPFNVAPDFLAAKLIYKILSYKFKAS